MVKNNYSIRFFYDSLPAWKRKIDSIPVRVFYRPASFVTASVFTKMGVSANTVSYISGIIGIIGCFCYLPNNWGIHILGAILINFWLVLDCTDGNMARCVKKQAYGEFADAIAGYVLLGFMCTCIGFAAYNEKGVLFESGCPWLIFLGSLASTSDALTRATYNKFKTTSRDLVDKGVMSQLIDDAKARHQRGFLRALFEDQFGLGGFLPLFILLATFFHMLDLIVIYLFLYYGFGLLATLGVTIKKAVIAAKKYDMI